MMRSHASQVTTQPADSKGLSHEVKPIAARSKLSLPTFFAHDKGREEQYFPVPWLRLTGTERNYFFLAGTNAILEMIRTDGLYVAAVARIILQYMSIEIHGNVIHYDHVNGWVKQRLRVPADAIAMEGQTSNTLFVGANGKQMRDPAPLIRDLTRADIIWGPDCYTTSYTTTGNKVELITTTPLPKRAVDYMVGEAHCNSIAATDSADQKENPHVSLTTICYGNITLRDDEKSALSKDVIYSDTCPGSPGQTRLVIDKVKFQTEVDTQVAIAESKKDYQLADKLRAKMIGEMAEYHNRTELAYVFGKRYHNQLGIYAEDLGIEGKHHRIRLDICLAQEPQNDVDFVLFVNVWRNMPTYTNNAAIDSAVNFYRQFAAQKNPNARFSLYAFYEGIKECILFDITYNSMALEEAQRKILEGLNMYRQLYPLPYLRSNVLLMPVIDELCNFFIKSKRRKRLRVFCITSNASNDYGTGIEGYYATYTRGAREQTAEFYYRIQCATVEGALHRLIEQEKDDDKQARIKKYLDLSMLAQAVKGEIFLPDELSDLLQKIENPYERYVAYLQLQGSTCCLEMNMVGVGLLPEQFLFLDLMRGLGNHKSKWRNVTVAELPYLADQHAHDLMMFDDPIPLATAVYDPDTKQQGGVISHATGVTNKVNTVYVEFPVSQVKDQDQPIQFIVYAGPKVGRVAVKLNQNQLQPNSEVAISHRRAVITNARQFGCDLYPWQGQLITTLTYNQHWLKYNQFRQEVEQTPGYGLQLFDEVKATLNDYRDRTCIFSLPPKPTVERSYLLHQSIDRTKLSETKWSSDHPRVAAMIDLWRFLESDKNRFVFAGESFTFAQCVQLHDENGFIPGGGFELFIEKLIILRNILADAMRHQCSIVHLSQVFLAHAHTLLKKFSDSPNEEFDRKIQKLLESFSACVMEHKHHSDYLIVVPNTWVRVKKSNGEVQVMDLQARDTEQNGARKIAILNKIIIDHKLAPNTLNTLMRFYRICNDNGWLPWLGTAVRYSFASLIKDRIQLAEFLTHLPADKQGFANYLLELHEDIIVGPAEKVKTNSLSTGYFDLLRNYMSINANPVHTYVQTNLLREFVKQFEYLKTNRQSELVNFYRDILLALMSQGTSAEYYDRIKLLFAKYYLDVRMDFQKKYGGLGSDFGHALQTVLRNAFKLDMPKEFHEPISLREAKVDYQAELVILRQKVSELNGSRSQWRFDSSGCRQIVFDEKTAGGNAEVIFNRIVNAILTEIYSCLHLLNTHDVVWWVATRRERIDACRNLLRQVGIYVPQRYYLVPKADNFTLTPLSAFDTTACSAAVAMLRKHGR